tara:strand:- start:514 stop:945 length:432 start_codon:yes stop_codon:yes gene_type:complete
MSQRLEQRRRRRMNSAVAALAIAGTVAACQTTQDRAQRAADIERDIAIAQKHFTDTDKDLCITDFKRNMHDPSSFEMAGPLELNRIWIDTTYGQKWDHLPPRRVVYTARIRGKNKFGGLVLNEMRCIYGVIDTGIVFAAAKGR